MRPRDHMQERSYLTRSLCCPWGKRKTLRVWVRLLSIGPRVCIPERTISCQLRMGGSLNWSMWQCGRFVIIYLMLDIMVLKIILLMLTDYSIQFQGIYFEKLCVSLFNHSCHIIIFEDETCISPTPINYATYWALSHPIIL